jgi:hypothetical protein
MRKRAQIHRSQASERPNPAPREHRADPLAPEHANCIETGVSLDRDPAKGTVRGVLAGMGPVHAGV